VPPRRQNDATAGLAHQDAVEAAGAAVVIGLVQLLVDHAHLVLRERQVAGCGRGDLRTVHEPPVDVERHVGRRALDPARQRRGGPHTLDARSHVGAQRLPGWQEGWPSSDGPGTAGDRGGEHHRAENFRSAIAPDRARQPGRGYWQVDAHPHGSIVTYAMARPHAPPGVPCPRCRAGRLGRDAARRPDTGRAARLIDEASPPDGLAECRARPGRVRARLPFSPSSRAWRELSTG
jgi:hypothetical protein